MPDVSIPSQKENQTERAANSGTPGVVGEGQNPFNQQPNLRFGMDVN
jgi:hypothetical protein